ncbi:hypothetical protein ACRRTK_017858 [Alexandromys fortis]
MQEDRGDVSSPAAASLCLQPASQTAGDGLKEHQKIQFRGGGSCRRAAGLQILPPPKVFP